MTMLQDEKIKLTHLVKCAGCAAKMDQGQLAMMLKGLPKQSDPNLLVGFSHADDAAIYRLPSGELIVQTVDFFPPIVDDPYNFGAIAATNAISDIYAMNGRPLFALNICGFPKKHSSEIWNEILRGGADKAIEAGIPIAGGHTIDDSEPKYGMVVTGIIDGKNYWTNEGAKIGDVLILTKPIGTGIITTALKNETIAVEKAQVAIEKMKTLNRAAQQVLAKFSVNCCTDVTGFGLLGHGGEVARASNVGMEISFSKVPIFVTARELATAGKFPGGTFSNQEFLEGFVSFADEITAEEQLLLFDAQTSGGLLACVMADEAERVISELKSAGVGDASIIGKVVAGSGIRVIA